MLERGMSLHWQARLEIPTLLQDLCPGHPLHRRLPWFDETMVCSPQLPMLGKGKPLSPLLLPHMRLRGTLP